MRLLYPVTILILGLATASVSLAHDSESCVLTEDEDRSICRHYFEGMTIDLPLKGQLERPETDCDRLVVKVLQQQGTLFAQLREPLVFENESCSTMASISLDLPDVRAETDLLIQVLHAKRENGQGDVRQEPVEVIALRVYPDTILDPLKRLAEKNSLIVYDNDGQLSSFFDQQEVDYITGFGTLSGTPIGLFVGYEDPERLLEDSSIEAAVIFREKIIDLPQVRTVSSDGRTRVYVEMNLLQDLQSSPLTQKALMKIINLAINPNPSNRG